MTGRGRGPTPTKARSIEPPASQGAEAVTERAMDELRASEARYRLMFEGNPQPLFVFERATLAFLEANEAALHQYGYSREEMLETTLEAIWPPEDVARNRGRVEASSDSRSFSVKHRRKDGTVFDAELRVHSLSFGSRVANLVLVNDVTERLRAEHARRIAEARFARLADSGILAIVIAALDGRILDVNHELCDLLGYGRTELLNGSVDWSALTPPEWQSADRRAREELTRLGVASLREKEYLRADGSRVPVLVGSAMVEGTEGECISFVLDLRDSPRLEAAIGHLRDALAAEERSRGLAAIVEASDDAIIGKTLDGTVTSWNDGARRLFGYAAEEMVGQSILRVVPSERAGEEAEILKRLAGGDVQRLDTVRLRKDGSQVHVAITSSPIRDRLGRLIGAAKVARDITDKRLAAEALERAKDTAEAASRELEAFSYSVAHDLRAPLRGMNGFAQLLLDRYGGKLDETGQDWLSEIVLGARNMGALIDALLALARVSRGELRRKPVDLSALARQACEQLRAAEPHRSVDLAVAAGLHADVDPALARAALDNLLGNAWKFTGKVAHARVEFGETERDAAKTFFVRDNGAGFDMAFAGKLFGPFQRLHGADEFQGTGIGLATVQRIVHRHGGRIWAEGRVGGGATFYFTLSGRPASGANT